MPSSMGPPSKPTGNGKSNLGGSIQRPGTPCLDIPTLINYNPTRTTYHGIYNNATQVTEAGHGHLAATVPTPTGYQLSQANIRSSSYSDCATSGSTSPRSGFWDSGYEARSAGGESGSASPSASSSPGTSVGGGESVGLPSFDEGFGDVVRRDEEEDRDGIPGFEEAFEDIVRRDVEASFFERFLPAGRR